MMQTVMSRQSTFCVLFTLVYGSFAQFYVTEIGQCAGGPGTRDCQGYVSKTFTECKALCDASSSCGAFDMPSHTTSTSGFGECCLSQPGNTGNGWTSRTCSVQLADPTPEPTPQPTTEPTLCDGADSFAITSPTAASGPITVGGIISVVWTGSKPCVSGFVSLQLCAFVSGGELVCFDSSSEYIDAAEYYTNDGSASFQVAKNLPPGHGPSCKVKVVDNTNAAFFSISPDFFLFEGEPTSTPTLLNVGTLGPSPAPTTLDPSPLPTLAPSSQDTVGFHVTLTLAAESTSDVTHDVVVPALAGMLGGASISSIHGFSAVLASSSPSTRRRSLSSVAVDVNFDVTQSLSNLGIPSAGLFEAALQSDLEAAIGDGSLQTALQANCGCSPMAPESVASTPNQQYPTLRPTNGPSLIPSSLPTFPPTFAPTPTPTLLPTVSCDLGHWFDGRTCWACEIGRYSSFNGSTAPFPSNCTKCAAGSYASSVGQKTCQDCAVGKMSAVDRSVCEDCSQGQYMFQQACKDCEEGKYAPTAQTGSCLSCFAGFYTNNKTASTSCTPCNAGSFSVGGASSCSGCGAGRYSGSGASACIPCAPGTFSPVPLASSCTNCALGRFSPQDSAVACEDCPVGRSAMTSRSSFCSLCAPGFQAPAAGSGQCTPCAGGTVAPKAGTVACTSCVKGEHEPATSQSACLKYAKGKYAGQEGALSCVSCKASYDSTQGASACSLAAPGFYLAAPLLTTTSPCPRNAWCVGGDHSPAPEQTFWVDRSEYAHASVLYKCKRATCKGATSVAASACWSRASFESKRGAREKEEEDTEGADQGLQVQEEEQEEEVEGGGGGGDTASSCGSDKLMCTVGSGGPLCGSCTSGFIYRGDTKTCGPCEAARAITLFGILAGVTIAALFGAMATGHVPMPSAWIRHLFSSFDTGSLKVCWVTYQIILSTSWTLDIRYPYPFSDLMGILSVFSLDFLAVECFQDDEVSVADRYFGTTAAWVVFPCLLTAAIVAIGFIRAILIQRDLAETAFHDEYLELVRGVKNQHTYLLLLLSYLVLPPVSARQLSSLDCIPLETTGTSFLRADTAIDCDSPEYKSFVVFVAFSIVLYQSIPFAWAVALYRVRAQLNPDTSNHDTQLALHIRDNNHDLDALRFLFNDYRPEKWFFECFEVYRRIFICGVIPLCSTVNSTRASFGCVVAIASLIYFREEEPYRVPFTNFISHCAQIVILVVFYAALSIDTGASDATGQRRWRKRPAPRQWSSLQPLAAFKAISTNRLPSTHVLVFHYTSIRAAKMAQRSGLPALERFGGVPLTLRYPHDVTRAELAVFQEGLVATAASIDEEEGKGDGADEGEIGIKTVSPDGISKVPANISGEQASKKGAFKASHEAVLVFSLPRRLLDPLPGHEADNRLCVVQASVLSAMRPTSFSGVVDIAPWLEGVVLLPPSTILRCFALQDETDIGKELDASNWVHETDSLNLRNSVEIQRPDTILEFLNGMTCIRSQADDAGLVPLFHYTSASVAPLIQTSGLLMSTQGQGDGGVYLSSKGPCSYGLGEDTFEYNVIRDCFGVSRMHEYIGKDKLNAVVVYGALPRLLEGAPGGRENARMVSRTTFEEFSLSNERGQYFLHPSRVLGIFVFDFAKPPHYNFRDAVLRIIEESREKQVVQELAAVQTRLEENSYKLAMAAAEMGELDQERLPPSFAALSFASSGEGSKHVDEPPFQSGHGTENPMRFPGGSASKAHEPQRPNGEVELLAIRIAPPDTTSV